jgi:hypothetical protein
MITSTNAIEQRARRAAKRIGLIAKKSRWRAGSIDNRGGFMLIDPYTNGVVSGSRFDLSPEDILDYCAQRARAHQRERRVPRSSTLTAPSSAIAMRSSR